MYRNTYNHPNALSQFKNDVKGRTIHILFYSASIEPEANVLCIEVTMEAFEKFLISQRVKSFIAEMDIVVTIESVETEPILS
jgi:hypothetical protein